MTTLFGFIILGKVWLLIIIGMVLLKFSFYGCHSHKSQHLCRDQGRKRIDGPKQPERPFDEKDIVPDGQSGF